MSFVWINVWEITSLYKPICIHRWIRTKVAGETTAFKKIRVCSSNILQREASVKFAGELVWEELDSAFFLLEGKIYVSEYPLISMQIQETQFVFAQFYTAFN